MQWMYITVYYTVKPLITDICIKWPHIHTGLEWSNGFMLQSRLFHLQLEAKLVLDWWIVHKNNPPIFGSTLSDVGQCILKSKIKKNWSL